MGKVECPTVKMAFSGHSVSVGGDACSCNLACAIGLPSQQHPAVHDLEQAKRRDSACARYEKQESHEFGVEGQKRTMAAALMRTNMATVVRLAVSSRPVCPSATRGITARIMTAVAPFLFGSLENLLHLARIISFHPFAFRA
jgi:hypothetical protein